MTAELSRGDIVETIQSTGQVKPTTEVQVGAQVSGRVSRVFVDFNSKVKKGDVLAEIDPTLFGAQMEAARAQLASANANVQRAEANLSVAQQRLDRAERLFHEGLGSQADLDGARGSYEVSQAELGATRATVAQITAQLRSSKTNLEFTRIYAPIDGVVINRAIDPGQVVAASFQAPTLFVIAEDLTHMRVLADIDEADVGKLHEGLRAEVSVDAFPGETFAGKVAQVRFSASNVSGVVTYAAVVEVDNPEIKLRPGMTATVTVHNAEAKGALRVPNSALRFKPTPRSDKEGKPLPTEPLPKLEAHTGRVYVLVDPTPGKERIEPRVLQTGLTDGIHTEVKSQVDGLKLVVDEADDPSSKRSRGPRMF